jgi:hypothetical protein
MTVVNVLRIGKDVYELSHTVVSDAITVLNVLWTGRSLLASTEPES